jgi:hypothetical protein
MSFAELVVVNDPPNTIARALCLYNLGHSQEQTARRIGAEFRVAVPRRTISEWILGYQSITTFHRFRSAALQQFGHGMLKERTLEHRQNYQYKVHLAKLGELPHHRLTRSRRSPPRKNGSARTNLAPAN